MNPFQHKSFSRLTFENKQIWGDKGRGKKPVSHYHSPGFDLIWVLLLCVCVHLLTSSVNVFTHEKNSSYNNKIYVPNKNRNIKRQLSSFIK